MNIDHFSYAMNEILNKIPTEVLQATFIDNSIHGFLNSSIENAILNRVIKQRVLYNINLRGGQMMTVYLAGLTPKTTTDFYYVFEIPKSYTHGRSILTPLSISFLSGFNTVSTSVGTVGIGTSSDNLELTNTGMRLLNANATMPMISTSRIELIADNTILIREQFRPAGTYTLRCITYNDENLSNLGIKSIAVFSELCVLAVKSYIYNKLNIKIDKAYMINGIELSSIREYVSSLNDAEEQYQDILKNRWGKVAYMADTQRKNRLINLLVPGNL